VAFSDQYFREADWTFKVKGKRATPSAALKYSLKSLVLETPLSAKLIFVATVPQLNYSKTLLEILKINIFQLRADIGT
jgi:hypothetical protein